MRSQILPKPSPNPPKPSPNPGQIDPKSIRKASGRPSWTYDVKKLAFGRPQNCQEPPKNAQERPQTGPNPPQMEPKTLPKSPVGAFFWFLCSQALFAAISWPMFRHFSRLCWSPCLSVCASRHSFNGSGACFCKIDMFNENAKKSRRNPPQTLPKSTPNLPQTSKNRSKIEKKTRAKPT